MVRLWVHNGAANVLFREIPVPAIVPSATLASFEADVDFSTPDKLFLLPTGYSLRASTEKGETFAIFAIGADYP
jgi:hypothetical protein